MSATATQSNAPRSFSGSRRLSRDIQAARDKLTSVTGAKPEFEYELLCMFARSQLSASLTIPLLAIIVLLASVVWAPQAALFGWLLLLFSATGMLLIVCRQFLRQPADNINLKTWRFRLMSVEFVYGMTWASIAFIGINPELVSHAGGIAEHSKHASNMFVFATLIIVISMRMMFASTALRIIYASTIPMMMAIVLRFALLDDMLYWSLAAMTIGAYLYFVFLVKGMNTNVLAMLEYREEKDRLIYELEHAKMNSDEARRRAEIANLAKSRFLATMSHELRTPLNAILGFSEIMQGELLGPHSNATYKEYSTDIHESGQHLLNLINEILDLSRIEAGRYELNEEPVNLIDVAEDCHRLLQLKAESKTIEIATNYTDEAPKVWADERALRQVCLNLLSNAIKFTPARGKVTISIGLTSEGEIYLSIKDTGPGIPEDEIPRVMSAFGQGSLAHETAEQGAGLGLSIVKGLVELHEGHLDLQSKVRFGTEVTVTLPKKRVMQALPAVEEALSEETRRPGRWRSELRSAPERSAAV